MKRWRISFLLFCVTIVAAAQGAPHRIYVNLMDPRENPDYERHSVKPPTWETFGNQTQFATFRGFGMDGDKIANYAEDMEKYTKTYDLGKVLWPSISMVYGSNLGDVADEIKNRGLFLFDIWGFVPGSGPGPDGSWQQYKISPDVFALLESKLGDHWLGMDNGEQDGRYIGGYAGQMYPISDDRIEQYLNFQRHFEYMGNELGNKLSTLVSLNYGHYFLKEGVYSAIGAETAQGLPNGQVYYAFIRGAGKQYGVPWFGNASVWNRWGWKTYGSAEGDHGPTKGTSLNLLKRLMYTHILYNCAFVGFESGWIEGDGLTPIGKIQQAAQQWVRANGQPGTMLTPVALMVDFYSGWTFPRHLYTSHVYRVWGNVPYAPGDYFTDGVLDMLYPGYQDASFYHNESGFIAPTPYGDIADCLMTDAPAWLLDRYGALIVAGELRGGAEIKDKLEAYVRNGGQLVITAGNLCKLPGGLLGVTSEPTATRVEAGTAVMINGETVVEEQPFELLPIHAPAEGKSLGKCGERDVAVELAAGQGSVVVLASPFGVPVQAAAHATEKDAIDNPLAKPYPMLKHVRAVVDAKLKQQSLFEAGEGLSFVTCRKGPGEYTVGITNNALQEKPFQLVSHCGAIESATELALDQSDKTAAGYVPFGSEGAALGTSGPATISGGDVRVFRVKVHEEGVQEIPHVVPPVRPVGRLLALRGDGTIQEQILRRPTFFEHYDGVVVDWRNVHTRSQESLQEEAAWLARQKVRIVVDLSSGANLYPDLRFVNNNEGEFAKSMAMVEDVLAKMSVLGSKDLLFALHRTPETNFTGDATWQSFETTVRDLCAKAATQGITVYLRTSQKEERNLDRVTKLMDAVAAPNLKLAPSTAQLLAKYPVVKDAEGLLKGRVGMWLVSASSVDAAGKVWTLNAPIEGSADAARQHEVLVLAEEVPIVFDAVYPDQDSEYADLKALR